ncbi:MAG: hypothetical protein LBP38_00350 [Desulfovibrio sp.]|jgi:hypothetical protein|nr:hypothetical protein [Desulfovibrio sp.]
MIGFIRSISTLSYLPGLLSSTSYPDFKGTAQISVRKLQHLTLETVAYGRLCPPAPFSRQGFASQILAGHFIPICFLQKANWYGGGEDAARKFLKNQALPVFQKLWRLAFKPV